MLQMTPHFRGIFSLERYRIIRFKHVRGTRTADGEHHQVFTCVLPSSRLQRSRLLRQSTAILPWFVPCTLRGHPLLTKGTLSYEVLLGYCWRSRHTVRCRC